MMSDEKNLSVMLLLGLSTLLFLYIPQFHYREYVGETYELEYYYHPPILFVSYLSFSFFHYFFIFQFTQYQLSSLGSICHFIKIYSHEILF
jgi:hypothetical protein